MKAEVLSVEVSRLMVVSGVKLMAVSGMKLIVWWLAVVVF